MNFDNLSTRYQIQIGKILVEHNLEWADIYATTTKVSTAKEKIVMLLVQDRILTTSEIASLLMTTSENVGKIYNRGIMKKKEHPNLFKVERGYSHKIKNTTKETVENNPIEETPTIKEKTEDTSPILKNQTKQVIENANENNKLDDMKTDNPNNEYPLEIREKQDPEMNRQNQIFGTLVSEKERVEKHLKAIEFLMEFYK